MGDTERTVKDAAAAVSLLKYAASSWVLQRWTERGVQQAVALLQREEDSRVQSGAPLTGVWRLVVQVGRRGNVWADERLRQTISPGAGARELRITRQQGVGPLVAELEGTMRERTPPVRAQRAPRYDLAFGSRRLGLLRLPAGAPVVSTVLVLDTELLVTMEQEPDAGADGAASFTVWAPE